MARAACLEIPRRASEDAGRGHQPPGRFLSRPSVTLAVMLLAVLAGGLCVAGGGDGAGDTVRVARR